MASTTLLVKSSAKACGFWKKKTCSGRSIGNARLARNLFEKASNAHANRMMMTAGAVDEASLVTLHPEDIPNT